MSVSGFLLTVRPDQFNLLFYEPAEINLMFMYKFVFHMNTFCTVFLLQLCPTEFPKKFKDRSVRCLKFHPPRNGHVKPRLSAAAFSDVTNIRAKGLQLAG